MVKLIKYEARKTRGLKLFILLAVLICEGIYIFGLLGKSNRTIAIGMGLLFLGLLFGLFLLGIEGILSLHRDLNTKQSYMLFLTPKTSYQILGAKMIENGISIILAAAVCVGIFSLNFSLAVAHVGGLDQLLDMVKTLMSVGLNVRISIFDIISFFLSTMSSWILMVATGFLAVILTATVLNGKKFCGVIAVILYFVISWILGKAINLISGIASGDAEVILRLIVTFAVAALIYVFGGWLMEKKLSV